ASSAAAIMKRNVVGRDWLIMACLLGVSSRHRRRNGVQARRPTGDFHGAGEENSRRMWDFLKVLIRNEKMTRSDEVPTPLGGAGRQGGGGGVGCAPDSALTGLN